MDVKLNERDSIKPYCVLRLLSVPIVRLMVSDKRCLRQASALQFGQQKRLN